MKKKVYKSREIEQNLTETKQDFRILFSWKMSNFCSFFYNFQIPKANFCFMIFGIPKKKYFYPIEIIYFMIIINKKKIKNFQ